MSLEARLDLSPVPRVLLGCELAHDNPSDGMVIATQSPTIHDPVSGTELPAALPQATAGTSSATRLQWTTSSVAIGNASLLADHVIAHVFSMPGFPGTTRVPVVDPDTPGHMDILGALTLRDDAWEITLSAHRRTKSICEALARTGRYGITHLLSAHRIDGQPFDLKSARSLLLDRLHRFLSFLTGRRIGIGIICGLDAQAGCLWQSWELSHHGPWHGSHTFNCWPMQLDRGMPDALWPGFMRWIHSPVWADHWHTVLYWHAESNQLDRGAVATDTGIILSQVALERLCFVYLTEAAPSKLSRTACKKLSALEMLEMTAGQLGLPSAIPQQMTGRITTTGTDPLTVAKVITAVRNNEVHPKKNPEVQAESYDAWNLAQWYLELMILRLCGYAGPYNDRAQQCVARWRMGPVQTPWSTGGTP